MHDSVLAWVPTQVDGLQPPVLEVGSYNVNGSVREYFPKPYTGVDMQEGPGVDKVADAHALPFEDGSFETVVSTEMIEHDPAFWLSLAEMRRVLKPGGQMTIVVPNAAYPIAFRDPFNCRRFTEDTWQSLNRTGNYQSCGRAHGFRPWR